MGSSSSSGSSPRCCVDAGDMLGAGRRILGAREPEPMGLCTIGESTYGGKSSCLRAPFEWSGCGVCKMGTCRVDPARGDMSRLFAAEG